MKACDICGFIFIFLLNGFTMLSLCTFSKDFFTRFSVIFHCLLFSNAMISFYLLLTIRKHPGKVELYRKVNKETESDNSTFENADLSFSGSGNNFETSSVVIDDKQDAELFRTFIKECKICNLEIPLRGKHCSRCGICVRKYDHHCFIVGGCVGEGNHFKFYIYLFTQSTTLMLAIYAILDTVSFYLDYTNEKYSKVPFILYPLLLILSCYLLLTTVLFGFHSYLIMTNQTTYEIYHNASVPYISKFKELKRARIINSNISIPTNMPFHPFDMGFIQNWKFVYYSDKEYDWIKYYKENLVNLNLRFNLCDNEYWSCF